MTDLVLLAVSAADAVPKLILGWNAWTVLAAVGLVALLLRRRRPLPALLLGVPAMVYAALQVAPAVLLANFAYRCRSARLVVGVTAAIVVGAVAYYWYSGPGGLPINLQSVVYFAGFAGGAGLLGRLLRVRQEQQEQLAALQESRRREHELVAESARAAERSELAREMHDVVSHQVSLIAVQAGALRVTGGTPEQVTAAAETIRSLAVQTNDELRQVLGALRNQDVAASLAAQHTIDDIAQLWRTAAVAGELRLPTVAESGAVPAAVQRATYRIAQEALTNVRRHAAGARVRLTVSVHPVATDPGPSHPVGGLPSDGSPGALILTVVNSARPHAGATHPGPAAVTPAVSSHPVSPELVAPGGAGLIGIAERVGWLGGTLTNGPTSDGGYHLRVRLPLATVPTR